VSALTALPAIASRTRADETPPPSVLFRREPQPITAAGAGTPTLASITTEHVLRVPEARQPGGLTSVPR
jgi:hypothetical protein